MPGPTFHHRMPGYLTFSFSHLCELARELNVSLDQDGPHSRIDHQVVMTLSEGPVLERTSLDRRPGLKYLVAQSTREGHALRSRSRPAV